MLRFIASMASGCGFGIVCAIVTVLGLVVGAPDEYEMLVCHRTLANFFTAISSRSYSCIASVAEDIQALEHVACAGSLLLQRQRCSQLARPRVKPLVSTEPLRSGRRRRRGARQTSGNAQ